jgi:hypothetical protein
MNLFIGKGKIVDVSPNEKVLRFNLTIQQKNPCIVPCVIINPDSKAQDLIDKLQNSGQTVFITGRLSSFEFEHNGKTIRKLDLLTFANNIEVL